MEKYQASVDARQYEPKDKHRVIFETLAELVQGEKMQLLNDHDPKPLYYQLMAEFPNQYDWEYLQNGPVVWEVIIHKK